MNLKKGYMVMNLKKLLLSCVLVGSIAFPVVASAGCNGSTSCTGKVDRTYFESNGDLYIRLTGLSVAAGTSCTASHKYGLVPYDHPKLKEFYAMALTAMSTGFTVGLRIVDSDANCELQYMYMDL